MHGKLNQEHVFYLSSASDNIVHVQHLSLEIYNIAIKID